MADVVATDKCYVDGVLAANAGDVVPSELADKYDWPVAKKGTKAAAAAAAPGDGES